MFKSLFRHRELKREPTYMPAPSIPDDGVEIPRYPPAPPSLSVLSPEDLLSRHWAFVHDLQQTLGLTTPEFRELVYPTLRNFTAHVGLLPAINHHTEAGGLLKHSLDVCFWSTRATEAYIFTAGAGPERRRALEPRWRLAATIAGLMHDIAKIQDMSVTSENGAQTWRPVVESLYSWATNNNIQRYGINLIPNRDHRYEQQNLLFFAIIVDSHLQRYLDEPGSGISDALYDALNYKNTDQILTKIVCQADWGSKSKWLKYVSNGMPVPNHPYDVR